MEYQVAVRKGKGYHMGQRTDAKLPLLETFVGDWIDVVNGIVGPKVCFFFPTGFQIFHQRDDDVTDE